MDNPYAPLLAFLGFGTLVLQIGIALGILLFIITFFTSKKSLLTKISNKVAGNALIIVFIMASLATISSLFLSEVARFTPCMLCWVQRIFMYPLVIISGVALFLDDMKARITILILSVIGLGYSIYHILVQFFPASFKCSDEVANCALKSFTYYGYITIPVMSLTAFGLIVLAVLFSLRKSR